MKPIAVGTRHVYRIETGDRHTAEHYGNDGVAVVATPVLIGFLETAAHECIAASYEAGEGSVGTAVNVRHLAAALPGAVVLAEARVTAVDGRRVDFAVEARVGEKLLMAGTHGRAVVDLRRFLASLGAAPSPKSP